MKQETAEQIVNAGIDLKIYNGYSGRGMFGKITVGVTGNYIDIVGAIAESGISGKEARSLKTDNMGLDTIIY